MRLHSTCISTYKRIGPYALLRINCDTYMRQCLLSYWRVVCFEPRFLFSRLAQKFIKSLDDDFLAARFKMQPRLFELEIPFLVELHR